MKNAARAGTVYIYLCRNILFFKINEQKYTYVRIYAHMCV